jgi:hypothetical protein
MMETDNFDTFRSTLEELQRRWTEEDERDKVSNRATIRLAEVYRAADANARQMFTSWSRWLTSSRVGAAKETRHNHRPTPRFWAGSRTRPARPKISTSGARTRN